MWKQAHGIFLPFFRLSCILILHTSTSTRNFILCTSTLTLTTSWWSESHYQWISISIDQLSSNENNADMTTSRHMGSAPLPVPGDALPVPYGETDTDIREPTPLVVLKRTGSGSIHDKSNKWRRPDWVTTLDSRILSLRCSDSTLSNHLPAIRKKV